jgi:gliding motility-associated lipoprotein GldD
MLRSVLALLIVLSIASCRPEVYNPKPSGYFRIDTPATHKYVVFDRPGYPYTFEYPVNCTVERDTIFNKHDQDNRFWININVNTFGCIINITYKEINKEFPLHKLMDDAWGLSYFHHTKADFIDTKSTINDNGVECIIYTVGGNSASRYQFAATDSVNNFMRGSIYFDVTPNADSLKPASDFMLQDLQHMLMTLRWRNGNEVQLIR